MVLDTATRLIRALGSPVLLPVVVVVPATATILLTARRGLAVRLQGRQQRRQEFKSWLTALHHARLSAPALAHLSNFAPVTARQPVPRCDGVHG